MPDFIPFICVYQRSDHSIIRFDKPPYVISTSTIHDFEWKPTVYERPVRDGGKITRVRRPSIAKQIVLDVFADTPAEYNDAMNYLADFVEYDNAHGASGKLIVNGQYCRCRLIGKYNDIRRDNPLHTLVTLIVQVEEPMWITEKRFSYVPVTSNVGTGAKRYPYSYNYSYAPSESIFRVNNTSESSSKMKITFYGPVTNPQIRFADNVIGLNLYLAAGEYAVIDQLTRTISKIGADGTATNCFNARQKSGDCFMPLPSGSTSIISTGAVDVTVYEQRSEPLWK